MQTQKAEQNAMQLLQFTFKNKRLMGGEVGQDQNQLMRKLTGY